ncbi:Calx-beta domain-containing protein [uncultured Roseivirga sp.]|uniref:Calx-beta domain-containing protein n=1 Tax=uncultured Roseivirga sp. TaxID=543088 RepID=UPI00258C9040|nr:Calx-beta domain-containing protein [uncultured Roseivirga sp.]
MMAKSFSLAVNGSGRCLSKLSNLSIGAIGFVDSYLKMLFTGHRSTARLIGLLTFVLVVQTLPFLQVNAQTIGSTITFEAGSARLLTGASTNPSATNIDGHSLGVSAVTSGNIVNITVNNTVSGISGGSDLAVIMTATGTNVTSFSYKSDNAANNFSLTSFAFAVATGTTQNITVQGYDNGSAVSGAITKTISSAGTTNFTVTSGDISASSGWGNIDEIRMTMNTPAPANFAIDDVLLAAAVASNNAPTDIALTSTSINQSVTAVNAVVGTLSTTDADGGDTHTYSLVAGTGDDDNASFNIDNTAKTLRTAGSLAAGTYDIRINTNDGTDDYAEEFTITVVDDTAPVFENSTPSAASIGGTGFTLNTDIDEAGDVFYVVLLDGATQPTSAEVVSGTGNGGAVAVTSGNASVNSGGFSNAFSVTGLTSETAYDVYVVARDDEGSPNLQTSPTLVNVTTADVTAPAVSSIVVSGAPVTNANSVSFTVTFSENVSGVDATDFSVDGSGVTGNITGMTGSGTTYSVSVGSISGTGTISIDLKSSGTGIQDGSSNAISGGFTSGATHTVDTEAPVINSINISGTPSESATSVNFIMSMNETIKNVSTDDFELTKTGTADGTISLVNSSTGTSFTIVVNNISGNGTLRLDVKASTNIEDNASNTLSAFTSGAVHTVDRAAPTIQSSSPADGASNVTLSQNLTITFDDNMAVGTGNITIVETGVGNFEQLDVTNGTLVSVSGATVTLNPAGTLKKGTNYHIEIDASALDDDAGNDFAGISNTTTLNFSTVDVVINEIVTDPQQDWSTSAFASAPGGAPGSDDEWVELYIKTAAIDFTGWTIELIDGSDVIGDLTDNGAFDVSNYISSGAGTFNSSEVGDYLVLGNPDGSGLLNNDVQIVLKDPGGAVVDQVKLGAGAGEAPTGNASSISDESVQRIPNGTDTDADDADFVRAAASIGAVNDASGPQITSLGLNNSNAFVEIFASEGLYSTNGGSGALEVSDIDISISGGTATNPVITSLKQLNGTSDLVGGESNLRVNFTTTGVADGGETVTINFADGSSVFDAVGNAAAATQSNNTRILNDLVDPYITGVSLAADNSYIDVTFNEGVYEDNCGGGGLTTADFDLQISNGTATVPVISSVKQNDSATEGSASALAGGETTIRVFFSVTGTPDGGETIEVDLQANEVFDINGRTGVADQTTNNTATLNDEASPTVLEVTSDASNGSFKIDDEINIYVQYSEEVFVTGTPQLELETGTTDRTIDYVDRSVSTLRFVYTVQAGDVNADLDVTSSSAFTLNGGTIQDAAGNNAVLTVPQDATSGSLKQNKNLVIDGVVPTITAVGMTNSSAKVGDAITVSITASEAGLSLNTGTVNGVNVTGFTDNGGGSYTATYTVVEGNTDRAAGDDVPVSFVLEDAAGNSSATFTTAISQGSDAIDANSPTITAVGMTNSSAKVGDAITVSITANEAGLSLNTGTVNGVNVTGFTDNGGGSYTATYTVVEGNTDRAAGDDVPVSFVLEDAAGNSSATFTTAISQGSDAIDANSPSVTNVTSSTANGTYKINDQINVQVVFSESVTVNDLTQLQLQLETGTADYYIAAVSGSGTNILNFTYTVPAGTFSSDLDYLATNSLELSLSGTVQDAAGNDAVLTLPTPGAANSLGNNKAIVIDGIAPTVTTIARFSPTTTPTNNDALTWDVTFSEAVSGVGTADFAVTGTTGTPTSVINPSGNIYRVTVSGGDLASLNGTVTLGFSGGQDITDVAGNALTNVTPTGTNNNSFVVDNTAATITSITAPANGSYNSGKNLTFTVNFSEAVTYDDLSSCDPPYLRIDVGGSIKAATYASGNGTNSWTFTYSVGGADSDSDGIVISSFSVGDVGVEDEVGNALNINLPTLPNTSAILVDNAAPTISTLSPADNATGVSLDGDFTLTFNEAVVANTGNVTVHRVSDDGVVRTFDVTNNTVVSISGSVVTFDNTSDLALNTEHYILVDNGAFEDVAENAFGGIISTSAWSFTTTDQTEISINDPSVAEGESGSTNLTFTVSLSQPAPAGGATVNYATSDGTANSASDYTAASGTVSFAVGESSRTVTVSVAGDAIVEDDETVTVTLTNPTGTNIVIGDATGVGTITNDDQATVTIADVAVDEEDGTATVSLVLDKAVDGGLTVDLSTADGTATTADSDYTALVSSPVTFTGTAGESKNVNITIGSDAKLEANETFTVSMSNLTPATVASGDIDITDGATVTINNDDSAIVTIADASGNEDDGAITLTATLNNPVQGGFTVDVVTADGTAAIVDSDYSPLVGQTLTFVGTAGETETFTVTPSADTEVEANETINVSMVSLSATTLAVGVNDEATVTITNDDVATLAIDDVTKNENADGGATTTYTFTATLTGSIDQAITVDFATSDGTAGVSDYTAATGTLNFAGTDAETQTFNVTVANDDIVELNETFTVTLSNVQAGGKNVTISDATGLGTITNDDAASISIDDVSKAENADGGATTDFVFTVTLDKAVDTGISLSYATNDATATTADGDYTSASGQLNFAGTANETEEITVTVANDGLAEFDEGFGITLSSLQASGRNVTISDNVGLGTIENDDTAGFTITETDGTTEITEAGGADSFDVVLDAEPLSDVVISITSGDTGEGTVSASTLTFTTANWNTAQTVTVTGVDDDIIDGTQSFNITLAVEDASSDDVYDAVADQTVNVDNSDDDVAGFTISKITATVSETGTTDQFTVVLDAEPASDVVINVSSNDTGEATVGSSALTFTSINWDTPQNVVITGTDDAIEDGHVMSTVTLSINVMASDSDFGGLADQTVTVTTNDDDDLTAPSGYSVTLNDALVGNAEVATTTFTFAGAEIGTTYNYMVNSDNGGTKIAGSGTIVTATDQITLADLSGLNDGTLTLSVTLTDASSNVGTVVTDDTVLDTTAPVAPIVTSVSDDTGSSDSDGITSDNTPSVNGTAEANATVEVFVGGTSVGTTTADGSGDWTLAYTGTNPLTDGTIAVTANATDAAGNTGATSTAVNVTIDTTAPAAATFSGITNDTGASSSDAIINDMSSVTISGTAEANATFDLTFNGVTYAGLPVDASGNWSLDISNALTEDATETVTVTVTDAAGNTGTAATYDITLDLTAPDAPTVDLDADSDHGVSDSDNLTNYTIGDAMNFSGTVEAGASVEVELTYNGTTFTGLPATTDGAGNWSIDVGSTVGGVLVDGTVNDLTLRAIATDLAGNIGTAGELTVVLDQQMKATLSPADNASDILPNANLVMDFNEDVYVGSGDITIAQTSDNTVLETIDVASDKVSIVDGVVTINPDNALLPPSTEFYVMVDAGAFTDDAGNSYAGISNNTSWTFTTINASVITAVGLSNDGIYGIGDELEVELTFSLPVTITGAPTLDITIGTETVAATLQAPVSAGTSATFVYTIQEGDLDSDGIALSNSLTLNGAIIVDAFNVNAVPTLNNVPSSAGVIVDGVKPTPTITSSAGTLTNAAFTATFTYDEAVTGFELGDITVTNGTASNFTNVTGGTVWSATITPTADGATTVTLEANIVEDVAGNSSKSGNTVSTTFDGTAPTVTSITRAEADQIPTGTTSRDYTVVFSEDVTGVDVSDFETVVTGTATATVSTVTVVDAKTYTVTVGSISGEGTIGLNAKAGTNIMDAATNTLAAGFTGEVYTTNFVATDISLSTASIQENNAVGAEIGVLSATDADAGDSHTYTLVSGTGDADNASFTITGNKLLAAEVFDFETKDSYSIRVRTADEFGGAYEKALTIAITNEGEAIIVVTGDGVFDPTVLGLSTTKSWTIENRGDAATEVRVINSTQGFSINPGSVQLNPGDIKNITAVFRPTEAKVYNGVVVFNYDITDNIQDNVLEVGLSGEGVIVTGVDNGQISEEQINVFPNPASNYVTIDLSELNGMPLNIQMINPTGVSKLEKEGYDKPELTIDVTNFESGLYIIQFSNERSLVRKKVLIRK